MIKEKIKDKLTNSHIFTEKVWEEDHQILPYYIWLFSATDEIHSFVKGMYYGAAPGYKKIPESKFNPNHKDYCWEMTGQPHYAKAGFKIAYYGRLLILLLTAYYASSITFL